MTPKFGACVKQLRVARGMSLQALADKAGCTKPHLWDLENGNSNNPTIGTLTGLAKALNVPVMRLVKAWRPVQ